MELRVNGKKPKWSIMTFINIISFFKKILGFIHSKL